MQRHPILHTIRASEVPPEIVATRLGKEVQEVLARLRPALIAWDLHEEHTQFFLDHHTDLTEVIAFAMEEAPHDGMRPEIVWYIRELREDLRLVLQGIRERIHASSADNPAVVGVGSCFAIHNRPSPNQPIAPHEWNARTLAFVETLRPLLATVIKPRYIDKWLQTPIDIFGGMSPMQMIERGEGERVRAFIERDMEVA